MLLRSHKFGCVCKTIFANSVTHILIVQIHFMVMFRLSLGANSLDVTMGTPCDFQQDLVSIHTENDGDIKPHLVTLGQLSHRLICLPDLDQLLTDNNNS